MIPLTAEQAQQIEEALEDIVRVFKFETGTPVEALAVIRAARAQGQAEQEPVLAKHQPCGCIICTCEDEEQCRGCGGWHCGTHPIGEFSNPLYAAPQPVKQEPVCECRRKTEAVIESERLL